MSGWAADETSGRLEMVLAAPVSRRSWALRSGLGVGGLVGTSVAATTVAVAAAIYLIDLLAPALDLPGWVHRLALTAHLGQPMVGTWDAAGVVACLVLAVAGLVLGAEGLARRDPRG